MLGAQSETFEAMALAGGATFTLAGETEPTRVRGTVVGADWLGVFGAPPALGRGFAAADSEVGSDPVAMLGHEYWRTQLAGDSAVIGRTLPIEGEGAEQRTIVGILAPEVDPLPWPSNIVVPVTLERGSHDYSDMARFWLLARVRASNELASARAELAAVVDRLTNADEPLFDRETAAAVDVVSFHAARSAGVGSTLWLLLGAVAAVLLMACANVANLLLARGSTRRQEMAIRSAIGAGRARIVRQLLTESTLLALAGGVAG